MICDMYHEVDVVYKPLLFKTDSFFRLNGARPLSERTDVVCMELVLGLSNQKGVSGGGCVKTFVQYKPRLNIE